MRHGPPIRTNDEVEVRPLMLLGNSWLLGEMCDVLIEVTLAAVGDGRDIDPGGGSERLLQNRIPRSGGMFLFEHSRGGIPSRSRTVQTSGVRFLRRTRFPVSHAAKKLDRMNKIDRINKIDRTKT